MREDRAGACLPRHDPRPGRRLAHRRGHCGHAVREAVAQGLNVVKVSVADVRVEHEVRLMGFTNWPERTGGSPREVSDRGRIRSILGVPTSG